MKALGMLCAATAIAFAGLSPSLAGADGVKEFFIVGDGIPEYLSGRPGDPAMGKKVAVNRKKGNCLACHKMPIPEEQWHGEVGPELAGVGSRMTEAELRLRVVNPKAINPETMMPGFYRVDGLHRVAKDFGGKTILSDQEVEDVVAYLKTLTD